MSSNTDTPSGGLTANDEALSGIRLGIAAALGDINRFDGRDIYDTFGWPTDPDSSDYLSLYLRNGYAKTVVDKPALTTWRDAPTVRDAADRDEPTEFEDAVERLQRDHGVWSYAARADRLAGIGQHGLMVFGLSDVEDRGDFNEDARESTFSGLDDIQQIRVFHEEQIDDIDYGGPESERWGMPVEYSIDISDDIDEETEGEGFLTAHWTRVIDVPATRLLDDETLARPRMEPVLNNLLDIEKTLGSVAEMAYRGADKGLHLNADPEKVDTSNLSDLEDEVDRWYHDVQPWLKTTGVEVNNLGGDVADPEGIIEPNLDEIAAQTGIPKRELRGNQQGEQAGAEQDEKSYFGAMAERREQFATPHIVRSLIDRLRQLEILADPVGPTYDVTWPDLTQLDESEVAELQKQRSTVIKNLATVVPDLRGERAEQYVEEGEFPDREDVDVAANDELDETDPAVRQQFNESFGLEGNAGHMDDEETEANQDIDLTPPESVQNNAQKPLDWREDPDKTVQGMTRTGWNRAEQLASGEALTPEDIQEIYAWFARHPPGEGDIPDGKEPWQDAGNVALNGWGGETMRNWVEGKRKRLAEAGELPPVSN